MWSAFLLQFVGNLLSSNLLTCIKWFSFFWGSNICVQKYSRCAKKKNTFIRYIYNIIIHLINVLFFSVHICYISGQKNNTFIRYRKNSIDRPGGIHFFSTHNFWTTCHRTIIKAYSGRKVSTLLEYVFIFVLLCKIQKLYVDKKWIPPGLSIEILRYHIYKI